MKFDRRFATLSLGILLSACAAEVPTVVEGPPDGAQPQFDVAAEAAAPVAVPDAYSVTQGATIERLATDADDLLDNDDLGDPAATIVSFGGGRVGGNAATNLAGTTVDPLPQGSGSVTVNADGSFSFTPPTGFLGNYRFSYKLQNSMGFTTATVTFNVTAAVLPTAVADAYSVIQGETLDVQTSDPNDLLDNDDLGDPAATIVSFGGGRVGGNAALHDAGTTVDPLPQGSGSLTVNADGSLIFTPPDGWLGNYRFSYKLLNAAGFSTATITISVELPSALDDAYAATGNIPIKAGAANGVLKNDAGGASVTEVQGSAVNVGVATDTDMLGRGNVPGSVILNADGSFDYDPPPGFRGVDTFEYGINGPGGTATVFITVSDMVWFVKKGVIGSNNRGTFNDPFLSVADFNAANAGTGTAPDPQPGDVISFRTANQPYTESDGFNLLNDQQLIGEGVALNTALMASAASKPAYKAFAGATKAPPILNVTGVDNNGIDLAENNTIRGLTIGDTDTTPLASSFGMQGDPVGNLFVRDVSIIGQGGGVDLKGGTLDMVFQTLSADNPPKEGIRIRGSSGTVTVNDASSTIVGSQGGQAVRIGGGSVTLNYPGDIIQNLGRHIVEVINTSGGHINLTGTVTQAHPEGKGVKIAGADGDVTIATLNLGTDVTRNGGVEEPGAGIRIEPIFNPNGTINDSEGTFTFNSVSIFVTGAGNAGVRVVSTVPSGLLVIGGGTVDALNVPAIDVELTALSLTSIDPISLNSEAEGIRLQDVTGTVSLTGTTDIDNSTNAGIDIQNSAGSLALDLQGLDVAGAGTTGIRVVAAGTGTMCLNLAGSSSSASGFGYELTNGATSTFDLQDFTGDGGVGADVIDWVTTTKGNNLGGVDVTVGSAFSASTGNCIP